MHFPFHGEDKAWFYGYAAIIGFSYILFVVTQFFKQKQYSSIKILDFIYLFWFQLFMLSGYFFFLNGIPVWGAIILFSKIVFVLAWVIILWSIFIAIWYKILSLKYIPKIENILLKISISTALWFIIWIYGIFLLAAAWQLHTLAVFFWMLVLAWISYRELLLWVSNINTVTLQKYEHNLSVDATFFEKYNFSKMVDELMYILITFLLSVNFISVFRPFPIGWDDLGAYMNYPKLLTSSGDLLALWKMYSWELYTSIGFLFWWQTAAFFLNSFSGVVAAIMVWICIRIIVPVKKYNFDFSLFSMLIIFMMPMTIFQLAKDMKLDFGLLFMSLAAIITILSIFLERENINKKDFWKGLLLFWLAWLFIGFAFSIKVTSLLLLLWVLGFLFYFRQGLVWFMWFLFFFLGAFTLLGFWSMMNVVVEMSTGVKSIAYLLLIIWSGIILHSSISKKEKNVLLEVGVLILSFFLALLPWWIKHTFEVYNAGEKLSISKILWGKSDSFHADYSILFSQSELIEVEKKSQKGISASGTTDNADWGRYFWYEKGINNYLKLPFNLSFQINQKGEFTDITFIFFALIPLIFVYLPFKREGYIYLIISVYILLIVYYFAALGVSPLLTNLFSHITLPVWYIFILAFIFLPFIYFYFTLDKTAKNSKAFLGLYSWTSVYVFLWMISSYGVVWYGIVMYVLFLGLIALCLIPSKDKKYDVKHIVVLAIIFIYVVQSVLPHWISNLKAAGSTSYKLGKLSEDEAIFWAHPDYLNILFYTNISPEKRKDFFKKYRNDFLWIVDDGENAKILVPAFQNTTDLADMHDLLKNIFATNIPSELREKLRDKTWELYHEIIEPRQDYKNKEMIFRSGTFLKYYITENNSRLYEDSLLFNFDKYFYNDDPEVISERLTKLWISTLLFDLNAATIDQDPNKGLTKRYEKMLQYVASNQVKLIETDSVCLRLWLDTYKKNNDLQEYMDIAGVNYGSDKGMKKWKCLIKILTLIQEKKINNLDYPYLEKYKQYLLNNLRQDLKRDEVTQYYAGLLGKVISNGFKGLFEIK